MTSAPDEPIQRLYGLPREEFTAERNALANELRAEGDSEGAAAVKALRKPTAAAWAVNQLVRAERDLVEALLGAGGELRQAHRQAASGRGAEQLRVAAEAERAVVDELLARAPEVLGRALGASLSDAVRNTLHAASSDDDARERVSAGTLVTDLRPVGLGPLPSAGRAERSRTPARARPASNASAEQRRAARAREAERSRELKAAVASEAAHAREVEAAERALERAEEAYARAREAADTAAARAKDARKRARAARAGLADAARTRARLENDRRE